MKSNKKSWILRWLTIFQRYTHANISIRPSNDFKPIDPYLHFSILNSPQILLVSISKDVMTSTLFRVCLWYTNEREDIGVNTNQLK